MAATPFRGFGAQGGPCSPLRLGSFCLGSHALPPASGHGEPVERRPIIVLLELLGLTTALLSAVLWALQSWRVPGPDCRRTRSSTNAFSYRFAIVDFVFHPSPLSSARKPFPAAASESHTGCGPSRPGAENPRLKHVHEPGNKCIPLPRYMRPTPHPGPCPHLPLPLAR